MSSLDVHVFNKKLNVFANEFVIKRSYKVKEWDGQMPQGNCVEGQCPTLGMDSMGKCPTIACWEGGHSWD